jgi:SAM-dependent methyltransferase
MTSFECRSCSAPLSEVLVDLGSSPLANSYLEPEKMQQGEVYYPLCVYLCHRCWLAQLPEFESSEGIFSDYAYFSSFSDSWLDHARRYVDAVAERFALGENSKVIEIASNDGYLLQYFKAKNIPCLGIEPAANVAEAAVAKGIPTRVEFFGTECAKKLAAEGQKADLLLGNNVLAHVPNLNDFVAGLKIALAEGGVLTMEFPHLLRLMDENQFDTIYHEHFSYFSLVAVERVFARHGLVLFDVEELDTHGGSLRIFVRHQEDEAKEVGERVKELRSRELARGMETPGFYRDFAERVRETKRKLLAFLVQEKRAGKSIVGYGAPAKGNTLLNYCGVRTDFVDYTVDRSPHKQGRFLPGTRIPIESPDRIRETTPDYVLILPWNLKREIMGQMADIAEWGGRFIVAIPEVTVL